MVKKQRFKMQPIKFAGVLNHYRIIDTKKETRITTGEVARADKKNVAIKIRNALNKG